MVLGSPYGVVHHGPGLHDERPVAALSEQEFTGCLVEGAEVCLQPQHPFESSTICRGSVQVSVDPIVGFAGHTAVAFEPQLDIVGVDTWL